MNAGRVGLLVTVRRAYKAVTACDPILPGTVGRLLFRHRSQNGYEVWEMVMLETPDRRREGETVAVWLGNCTEVADYQ